MDASSMDAEILETLNYLRPPVKRNRRRDSDFLSYVVNPGDQCSDDQIFKKSLQHRVKSSLSLILQKTCTNQIFQKYTLTRKTPKIVQHQIGDSKLSAKPTIKVTVIPKTNHNYLVNNCFETKYQTNRKVRKTPFNDSSVATRDVYVVVAGKKKDKIYEIRTRGSKTLREHAKDVNKLIDNNTNYKMEKKRKKSTSYEVPRNLDGVKKRGECSDSMCTCRCNKNNIDQDDAPGSSRVKIVGRIGLNENDKYVMKCAATVNGSPVTTKYFSTQHESDEFTDRNNEQKHDNNINRSPIHFSFGDDTSSFMIDMSTQTAPVDMNIQVGKFCPKTNQTIQCNMCDTCIFSSPDEDSKSSYNLNRSTSPLVIISVYPKPEIAMKAVPENIDKFAQKNEAARPNDFLQGVNLYNTRGISFNKTEEFRCCPCETGKKDQDVKTNNSINKTNQKRSSSPPSRPTKPKKLERKKDVATDTNAAKPKSRSPSPGRFKQNDNKKQANSTKPIKVHRAEASKQNNKISRPKSKLRENTVSNNVQPTDTASFSKTAKKLTNDKRRNSPKHILLNKKDDKRTSGASVLKKSYPKNDISKVSINIDSDREFYDVVFENGKGGTDFTVRRTAKNSYGQKYFEETFEQNFEHNNDERRKSDSLENFFPMIEMAHHRRSASQAFNGTEGENVDLLIPKHLSRLNVRDSIEIGHKREHSKDHKSPHFDYVSAGEEDEILLASKHFPGDDCDVEDPLERDREIRSLLGIDNIRISKKRSDESVDHAHMCGNNTVSTRCLFHNTLCKHLFEWSLSSGTKKFEYIRQDAIKEEDKSITDDEKRNLKKLNAAAKIKKRNVNIQAKMKTPVPTNQQSTQFNARQMALQSGDKLTNNKDNPPYRKIIFLTKNQYRKVKRTIYKGSRCRKMNSFQASILRPISYSSSITVGSVKARRKSEYVMHWNKEVQTDSFTEFIKRPLFRESKRIEDSQVFKMPNANRDNRNVSEAHKVRIHDNFNYKSKNDEARKIASSVEIRYASIAYNNNRMEVERSFADIKYFESNLKKRHDSIETLFRGHQKAHTPNLGTSGMSLLSEDDKLDGDKSSQDLKRKPFLKRLMSCLVMRSQNNQVKLPEMRHKPPTPYSTVDSYHISTSLGAIEMGSSMYDTTASFYSNHTIGAINNKTKRGFFSSVRGFLGSKINDAQKKH